MRATVIALTTGLVMAGCSPAPSGSMTETAAADQTEFGFMDWPDVRRYCTFSTPGQAFDAGDESTWRFVFVKPFAPSGRDAWAVVALEGERQMLDEVSRRQTRDTDFRRYEVVDRPGMEIEVRMVSDGRIDEPGDRSATLQMIAPGRGAPVDVTGRCSA